MANYAFGVNLSSVLLLKALEACKQRILFLQLPYIPETFTEMEKSLRLSSFISFDSENMVCNIYQS